VTIKASACIFAFGLGAWAQQEEPKVEVKVEGFRYPPIARSARIQGDVIFEVSASEPRLISSAHPILTEAARKNLETWTLPPFAGGKYLVRHHFGLAEPGTRHETVQIGDQLDRFLLELFRAPTTRVVMVCDYNPAPETQVRQAGTRDGEDYVIDVFAASKAGCLFAP
jgi:hypothetical protein